MKWIKGHIELLSWCLALLLPLFVNPANTSHFSLCFFKYLGMSSCPGCGLGRSIAYFYQGEVLLSFQKHWLGIATVVLLFHRIIHLLINQNIHHLSQPAYEPKINDDASGHAA
jgi:hypothetical protein